MTNRLALFVLLSIAFIGGCAVPAHAQRIKPERPAVPSQAPAASTMGSRILAVVNDNIITSSDLRARMGMALISSGLPDTPEVRQRLVVQILRIMIDEQLELQEAKKQGITVSNDEIEKALNKIAEDNHIPGGDMKAFLSSRGIPPEALSQQIRAGLSWNRVIQRELRPRVDIGDDEVDAAIERMRANAGKDEYMTSEIFLSVDNPKDEDQVKKFAEGLVQQLKQGVSFGAIARQFSQSASAASGGDIGWIQEGQLAPDLNRALSSVEPGQISEPVRAPSGYYILGVREKRTISVGGGSGLKSVQLQQVFRPYGGPQDKEPMLKEAAAIRSAINSCADLKDKMPAQFPAWKVEDLGDVQLATAAPWLAEKVRDLPVGRASEAMAARKGALILFVCGRSGSEDKADREAIYTQIGTEKLELQARGLLRDLRRDAFLDVRVNNTPNG